MADHWILSFFQCGSLILEDARRYNYNTAQAADERMRNPTPRQLQIMELLTEKRQKAAMNEATSRR